MLNEGSLILAGVLVFLALLVVGRAARIVPQGQEWTVERLGRYRATLRPGLNLIVPFIDGIGARISVQEQVLEIPQQNVITRDNAVVRVDGVVFYVVIDPAKAAYSVADLRGGIVNLCLTNLRTAVGSLDLDEVLSKRDEINTRLLTVVDGASAPWGTKITRVELKDVQPPDDIVSAMAKQLTAERTRRAQILSAEGFRQAEILKAEGEKQATILAAEGRLEAAKRDADARERLAEAEAAATRMVSEAVAGGSPAALNYFVAQKYVDALQAIAAAPQSRLVIVPIEAAGAAGTIAGLGELIREAFPNRPPSVAPPRPGRIPDSGAPLPGAPA